MSNASLSFLPWVRQGAAAAITVADTPTGAPTAVAAVAAALTVNGAAVPGVSIRLRGPADVVGIDHNQIVRTDPRPDTSDFETNCFPSIEFDRPDFPWLFTPAKPNASNQLRPWLCLVVVRKQAGVTLTTTGESPMSTLTIAAPASLAVELPDLKDSWAWAHAQIAGDDNSTGSIDDSFERHPERTLSRLVSPRILAAETDYVACVVPTFDVGRKAGLGLPITSTDLATLAPAWLATTPAPFTLPVYYHWEFRTNQDGSFESLARRLKLNVATGLGQRTIDISQPGFPAAGATIVGLEGALAPIAATNGSPPDPISVEFKTGLAAIVNEPARVGATDPAADPVVAPPLYGQWHRGKPTAGPSGTTWLDQLNLDPRWRIAAAFGTRVIQEHQEALMASAWEQAAALPAANQRMRQLQLSMAVGEVLLQRHFAVLSEETILRVAAPAFGRVRVGGVSLLAQQIGTKLPPAANRAAMRRIGRQRGPLSRRVAAKGAPRSPTSTWVARLNDMYTGPTLAAGQSPPLPPTPPLPPPLDFAPMPALSLYTARLNDTMSSSGVFFVAPELAPLTEPPPLLQQNATTEIPDLFRTAAREHITSFFPPRPGVIRPHFIVAYRPVKSALLERIHPRVAIKMLADAVISPGSGVLAPTARGVAPIGVETIMAAPYFPQPMYEALRDLSQELLLPGLETVPPDTVCGLRTNTRFVESYMVGLNHEMGRELLWRGYPTDQRGTYFDHFWGNGVPNTAPADITPLHTWGTRQLGDSAGAPVVTEEFVLLLRSSLLKRYPNAVIYLTPAIVKPGGVATDPDALIPDERVENERTPIFSGSLHPDVAFFGFPVPTAAAIGGTATNLGYYVIIQEHPTESRFGISDGVAPAGASYLPVTPTAPMNLPDPKWNTTAAEMARITQRVPVRVAIHASRLITPA